MTPRHTSRIERIVTCAAGAWVMVGAMGCSDLEPARPVWRTAIVDERSIGEDGQLGVGVDMDASTGADDPSSDTGDASIGDLGASIRVDARDSDPLPETPDERGVVTASLHVEEAGLVARVRNHSGLPATLRLSVSIDTPLGSYLQRDAGELLSAGGETLSVRWPPGALPGFDVASSDWLRTVLVYEFVLQDGRQRKQTTELVIRNGQVVPAEQAMSERWRMPDSVLDDNAQPEITDGNFKACFGNVIDLRPALSDGAPTPCPFGVKDDTGGGCMNGLDVLVQNHQVQPMPGQVFSYTAPDGTSGAGTVDAAGCTPPLARQVGDWQFNLYLAIYRADPDRTVYFLDDQGRSSFAEAKVRVEAQGDPPTTDVRVAAEHRSFQAAVFLAQNTLERAHSLEAIPPRGVHLRISPESAPESPRGSYCHAFGMGCTAPRTLRVHPDVAHDRGLIAHETGHFIQAENLDCPSCDPPSAHFVYDYGYTNVNASDGCRRTEEGHDSDSIEWQSAAHLEGLAGFFVAVSYNEHGDGADCQLPEYAEADDRVGVRDCEAVGMTPSACLEWQEEVLLGTTGNALDWTKLYWDFLTDVPGANFGMYLLAERNMAGTWSADGHGNHFERISFELRAIDEDVGQLFREARWANTFDGFEH